VVSRDDNGNPGDAVRVAEELIAREKVSVLMGTFPSHVGLAVSNLANQRKIVFVAAEPLTDKIVWENGSRYTFRLRPSTYMQTAMLVPEAAKLKKQKWAIVYPNYEYGQSATASFKKLMTKAQPGVQFVGEQAPPLGKIDAGAVVQALLDAKPDAIFSSLFGPDLQKFVREGNTRGLFKGRPVFNLLAGEPEYLDPLKDETPEGWVVTGYPWNEIKTPEHQKEASHDNVVGHRKAMSQFVPTEQQRTTRYYLHREACQLRQQTLGQNAVPEDRGTFDGPQGRGDLGAEGERNGQREEGNCQAQLAAFDHFVLGVVVPIQHEP
jgi:ABC-type branched-subunit amino acid transport system substrate-binding protein